MPPGALWAHQQLSATSCPGGMLNQLVLGMRQETGLPGNLESVVQWQAALVKHGQDLGTYGPRGDGVDGLWGLTSIAALRSFQSQQGLAVTGRGDWPTAEALLS